MKSLYPGAYALLFSILTASSAPLLAEKVEAAPGPAQELDFGVEACAFPEPPVIPDGMFAQESELAASMAAMRTYHAAMEASLECIGEIIDSLEEDKNSEHSALTALHDNGVEQLQTIAESFNQQVRIFKARQSEQSE